MTIAAKPPAAKEPAHEPGHPPGPPPAPEPAPGPVYVFELPVRVVHWTIFLDIVVLSLTGYFIGNANLPDSPYGTWTMQALRFIHVVGGWLLLAAMVLRIGWMFLGNEFASWREWVPSTRQRLREIAGVFKFYTFLSPRYPEPAGGHNPMAGLAYCVIYAIFFFMFFSGMALEGAGTPGDWHMWLAWPVAWIPHATLRFLHHLGMWVIWLFVAFHIGVATLIDQETRGNCFSAIFSGWRSRLRVKKEEKP